MNQIQRLPTNNKMSIRMHLLISMVCLLAKYLQFNTLKGAQNESGFNVATTQTPANSVQSTLDEVSWMDGEWHFSRAWGPLGLVQHQPLIHELKYTKMHRRPHRSGNGRKACLCPPTRVLYQEAVSNRAILFSLCSLCYPLQRQVLISERLGTERLV